jgi:hypothetical protein
MTDSISAPEPTESPNTESPKQNASRDQSLAEKIAQASFIGRLALTWPFIVAISFGLIASAGYIGFAEKRADELQTIASELPNVQTIQRLKDNIAQLKTFIPPSDLQTVRICNNTSKDNNEHCDEQPSSAMVTLNQINSTLDHLEQSTLRSQDALRRIRLALRGTWGAAFADTETFPSSDDKSFMLHVVFAAIVIMTVGCFITMLVSSNSRAVTYSIDALKFFGGLYAGIIGSVFGIRK